VLSILPVPGGWYDRINEVLMLLGSLIKIFTRPIYLKTFIYQNLISLKTIALYFLMQFFSV